MYLGGSAVALIMALGYYIFPVANAGYVAIATFALIGFASRIVTRMSIARIGAELVFLGTLILLTPENMTDMLSYFGATYIMSAYLGSMINASYRSYVINREVRSYCRRMFV